MGQQDRGAHSVFTRAYVVSETDDCVNITRAGLVNFVFSKYVSDSDSVSLC